ncbi:MAG: hypothetical protein NPINA01_05650 [Nitrospinaceae bacterium]|nr:MAG: hypothetical protein NPINA01_05650 [Nitrospinaceae bacterium]
MRETKFYSSLRPYIHQRLKHHKDTKGYFILEGDEENFSIEDRYFAKLDIIFNQLFQNIQIRQYWKSQFVGLRQSRQISVLALGCLHRAYINELVILFERLEGFLVLLNKAFRQQEKTKELEQILLQFFDPLIFKKRNYNHHQSYLWFPGHTELATQEERALQNENYLGKYYEEFIKKVDDNISWIESAEKEISNFLKLFVEAVEERTKSGGTYLKPTHLPSNFYIKDKLKSNLRQNYLHDDVFEKGRD